MSSKKDNAGGDRIQKTFQGSVKPQEAREGGGKGNYGNAADATVVKAKRGDPNYESDDE